MNGKRLFFLILAGAFFAGLSLYGVYYLSHLVQSPENADPNYIYLLGLSGFGLSALLGLAIWQIIHLIGYLKSHRNSIKLSLIFTLALFSSSIIPVGITYYFSLLFLSLDLDSAFNTKFNQALDDSLLLSRTGVSMRANEALQSGRYLSNFIQTLNHERLIEVIEPIRREVNALSLTVFDEKGVIIAFAHQKIDADLNFPTAEEIARLNEQNEFFKYINTDNQAYIRVLIRLEKFGLENYYLQSDFAMPEAFYSLEENIRQQVEQQKTYRDIRPLVRQNLYLALSLVFVLAVLLCLWLSILFAQYMTAPLSALIEATHRIGDGNYAIRIKEVPHNELGKLARYFNQMSDKLAHLHADLKTQNAYLKGIMDNILSGVLVFDGKQHLESYNQSACRILDLNPQDLPEANGFLELKEALFQAILPNEESWQREITLNKVGQRKVLMCHGSQFANGLVVVFDDLTHFVTNKRHSAWEEVAKRFAHEIKNPLTPIQLQTERLRKKLAPVLNDEKSQEILQRATHTIINQVEVLKQLVDDFGLMARPLNLRQKELSLISLLKECKDLYHRQLKILWTFDSDFILHADPNELRQVFNNLLKNALEAGATEIQMEALPEGSFLKIIFTDNGTGFPDLSRDPFEPYVSSKEKGMGLGLAIVRKIINEHGGNITAGNRADNLGAQMIFYLPLVV